MTFLSVLYVTCRDAASEIRVSPNKTVTVEKANADNIKDEEGMTGLFPSPLSQDVVLLLLLNNNSSETEHIKTSECQCYKEWLLYLSFLSSHFCCIILYMS